MNIENSITKAKDKTVKLTDAITKASKNIIDKTDTACCRAKFLYDEGYSKIYLTIHGYPSWTAWNIGDVLTERVANICGYLCEQSYKNIDLDYFTNLRKTEDILRAFISIHKTSLSLWDKPFTNHKEVDDLEDNSHKKMLEAWEWYGRNIMNPDVFVKPGGLFPKNNFQKAVQFCKDVKDRYYGGYTNIDMKDSFCVDELRLYVEWLYKNIRHLHGSPCYYYEKGYNLKEKKEDWKDRQCLALMMVEDGFSDYYNDRDEEKELITPKTREQIGLDFCAWLEDLIYAAEILSLYAEWLSPVPADDDFNSSNKASTIHTLSLKENLEIVDAEYAYRLDKEIREEFMKVWMWMGKNILALWN